MREVSFIKVTILICTLFGSTSSHILSRDIFIAGSHHVHSASPDEICHLFEMYDRGTDAKGVRERLANLALFLKTNPAFQGYIVSYAGLRSCRGEALKR